MKYIKIYFVLFAILVFTQIFQAYYNYETQDIFESVKIYNYYARDIRLIENGENLILFDINQNKILVVYKTKYVIMLKDRFSLLRYKNDYNLSIIFTNDFLSQF